jgi:putative transposase
MSSGVFNQYTGYHNRRSTRLPGFDYSHPGAYFVTVCIHDRKQEFFGNVVGGIMVENDFGNAVRQCWNDLPAHYPHIRLDEFIIMPNHLHGIIVICDSAPVVGAGLKPAPTKPAPTKPINGMIPHSNPHRGLPEIVRALKTFSARRINEMRQTPGIPVWQRNYYDHIIRDAKSHYFIRQYVRNNPANWTADSEHHLDNEIGI